MALDLLKQIASSPLPMYFRSSEDIDKVRLLRAAGLVIAFVPTDADPLIARPAERAAEVFAVTQKGRETLHESGYPDEQLLVASPPAKLTQRLRTVVERARQTLR
ncbi:MAG: hypothetical protein EOP75_01825 [Variovorax sp.]|nr:MAG: hypothetical protein EOP75_01825 [Variovorax sp.]